ncbi:MAG: hypothetical protein KF774_02260 [Planctomyces sp.]|nr:hypothetical protein [Planctomyces sp.]
MKRTVPLLITSCVGALLIASTFIPVAQSWSDRFMIWFDILAAIAFVLGGGNLVASQLRKVSDRRPGWGYALITLISFLLMLSFGLLKLGVKPAPNQEYFGESFARLPVEALPEFPMAADVPASLRSQQLPASVRKQVRWTEDGLVVNGWLTPEQSADLVGLNPVLEWQCAIERLAAQAQPPVPLQGRLFYHPDHRVLAFRGWMSEADEIELRGLADGHSAFESAATQLAIAARRKTTVSAAPAPEGFQLPPSLSQSVTIENGQASILGPMSAAQRNALATGSLNARRELPGDATRDSILAALTDAGPLTAEQRAVVEKRFLDNPADALIAAINTAGVSAPTRKTACELMAERNAGVTDLVSEIAAGPPSLLNAEQENLIRERLGAAPVDWDALPTAIEAAGSLTPAQTSSIAAFRSSLPTTGALRRTLFEDLLRSAAADASAGRPAPTLNAQQRTLLLAPYLEEHRWRQSVRELFRAAHVVKYPWSGEFNQQGAAFWWCYEYIFQPITAMMFALLAFYVASAAFRAFRAKNVEATLLLGTAFIILLGRTYAGVLLTDWLPKTSPFRMENLAVYLMNVFNSAGNRAIMIGIALGIASTSLKILLGIDRSHVGGKE